MRLQSVLGCDPPGLSPGLSHCPDLLQHFEPTPGNMKNCSQATQPPHRRVITSNTDNARLVTARSTSLYYARGLVARMNALMNLPSTSWLMASTSMSWPARKERASSARYTRV